MGVSDTCIPATARFNVSEYGLELSFYFCANPKSCRNSDATGFRQKFGRIQKNALSQSFVQRQDVSLVYRSRGDLGYSYAGQGRPVHIEGRNKTGRLQLVFNPILAAAIHRQAVGTAMGGRSHVPFAVPGESSRSGKIGRQGRKRNQQNEYGNHAQHKRKRAGENISERDPRIVKRRLNGIDRNAERRGQ